jgi:hypothetical protein
MAAAQNFRVAVKNHTKFNFIVGNESMNHGGVYEKANIKARTTTTTAFFTRGDNDASAGTEGQLTYTAKEGPTITFKWDIPWGVGSDTLDVTVTGDIKLETGSFRGDSVLRKLVEIVVKDDDPIL